MKFECATGNFRHTSRMATATWLDQKPLHQPWWDSLGNWHISTNHLNHSSSHFQVTSNCDSGADIMCAPMLLGVTCTKFHAPTSIISNWAPLQKWWRKGIQSWVGWSHDSLLIESRWIKYSRLDSLAIWNWWGRRTGCSIKQRSPNQDRIWNSKAPLWKFI